MLFRLFANCFGIKLMLESEEDQDELGAGGEANNVVLVAGCRRLEKCQWRRKQLKHMKRKKK